MMVSVKRKNGRVTMIFSLTLILFFSSSVYSLNFAKDSVDGNTFFRGTLDGRDDFTNITVAEAWEMLTDPSQLNGIQIPIDVRRDSEWKREHIDTPFPENPRHVPLSELEDSVTLQEFISQYQGQEIILYCASGGRSFTAVKILMSSGFTGTIYNMIGGISAWKDAGYPTIGNQPPGLPTITGPTDGKIGKPYPYIVLSIDPDDDNLFYCVNWSDSSGEICYGPYPSGQTISLNHSWDEKGSYTIKVKARDRYGDESGWASLEVKMPKTSFNPCLLFSRLLKIILSGFL